MSPSISLSDKLTPGLDFQCQWPSEKKVNCLMAERQWDMNELMALETGMHDEQVNPTSPPRQADMRPQEEAPSGSP